MTYQPGDRVWCVCDKRYVREATVLGSRGIDHVHGYNVRMFWELGDDGGSGPMDEKYYKYTYPIGRDLVWPTKQDALRALVVIALAGDAPATR
jgi:hypothetical protein